MEVDMSFSPQSLLLLLVISGFHPALAQSTSEDKQAVESFKSYIQQHFASYKQNRRERVTMLGGGWVKEYFEPNSDSASIDVQKTTSLITPYTGKLDFQLVRHMTGFHKTREDAAADSSFVKTTIAIHHHTYAFQDGKWLPKVRQHESPGLENQLFRCDEVITQGPDAGEKDINGCLEEYDSPTEH
jgi:hypothetical protein